MTLVYANFTAVGVAVGVTGGVTGGVAVGVTCACSFIIAMYCAFH